MEERQRATGRIGLLLQLVDRLTTFVRRVPGFDPRRGDLRRGGVAMNPNVRAQPRPAWQAAPMSPGERNSVIVVGYAKVPTGAGPAVWSPRSTRPR